MNDFSIRPYDAERDAAGLRECFVALQDHEHDMYPDAPAGEAIADEYLAWMFERVGKFDGAVLVASDGDGTLIGFATVLARVPRSDPDDPDPSHAFLSELSVMPAWRGRGVGAALIEASEKFSRERGARVLRVTVVADNDGAQRLYARQGFEPVQLMLQKALPGS